MGFYLASVDPLSFPLLCLKGWVLPRFTAQGGGIRREGLGEVVWGHDGGIRVLRLKEGSRELPYSFSHTRTEREGGIYGTESGSSSDTESTSTLIWDFPASKLWAISRAACGIFLGSSKWSDTHRLACLVCIF